MSHIRNIFELQNKIRLNIQETLDLQRMAKVIDGIYTTLISF
jgi:hypothetical protein